MRLDSISRHLLSGVLVYVIVAACSGSDGDNRGSAQGGHGGALVDALVDPVSDVSAAEAGCSTCTVSGTVKVITADADPNQLVGGHVDVQYCTSTTTSEVTTGPLVLTDVQLVEAGGVLIYTVAQAEPCIDTGQVPANATWVAQLAVTASGTASALGPGLHGARVFVDAGRKLCACSPSSPANLYWSGFRPYAG